MKKFILIIFFCISQIANAQDSFLEEAETAMKNRNYDQAIYYIGKALESIKKTHGELSNKYAYALALKTACFYRTDDKDNAVSAALESVKVYDKIHIDSLNAYLYCLDILSRTSAKKSNFKDAILFSTKAAKIIKQRLGEKDPKYENEISSIARLNNKLGNHQEAIRLKTEAVRILKDSLGEKHSSYAYSLDILAGFYDDAGNYQEAIRLKTEALKNDREGLDKTNPYYDVKLNNLARLFKEIGNYQEAILTETEALNIREEKYGILSQEYAISLGNIASYNSYLGNNLEAIRLETMTKNIRKIVLGEGHTEYIISLNNLAHYNNELGNYPKAIEYGTEAVNIIKKIYGNSYPYYDQNFAISLNNLSAAYRYSGNFQKAIQLATEALQIADKTSTNYTLYLDNLSICYQYAGNYQKALELATKAKNIINNDLNKVHPNYASSLNNLANINKQLGNYEKAIQLASEELNILENTLGKKHTKYATSLSNLASCYPFVGNILKAIKLSTEATIIFKEVFGEMHPAYAISLSNLAIYNALSGNYQEAIRLTTKALSIKKEILGKNHPRYAISLNNLAAYYYEYNGVSPEQANLEQEAFVCAKRIILQNLATMTPYEMSHYWKSNNGLIIHKHSPKIAYDASLLSKGLLLTAETGINELIQQSGDSKAIAMLENIKTNTLILNKQLEKPINERNLNTDSLSSEIEKERKALAVQSKEFGDFTRYFSTTWQDVRNSLKKNEAAIEFDCGTKDNWWNPAKCTRAMILRKDSKEPELIYLQLDSLKDFKENIMTNWTSIQQKLKGIDSVYFSPAGELYSTPIENLINDGKEYIRVSSTREIVLNHESAAHTTNGAMRLYGGLAYDMTLDDLTDINEQVKQTADNQRPYYEQRSSRDAVTRSGFKYLRGTLDEVKSIEATAKAYNIQCNAVTGENGTEESLRNISGKKFGILHFATHGFYWTEEDVADKNSDRRLSFLIMNDNTPTHTEDKSMTRSGLIFSGANLALRGIRLPEGMEDGIATAKEISHLDLRGCDLVVLSACQTGLGDISGEGVFGLQRGFRKAGVKSILMSLWEVDDNATQMLMTEFYRNYLKGESKLKSLRKAQDHVKAQPGFEAPEYWAGFILLDGLE